MSTSVGRTTSRQLRGTHTCLDRTALPSLQHLVAAPTLAVSCSLQWQPTPIPERPTTATRSPSYSSLEQDVLTRHVTDSMMWAGSVSYSRTLLRSAGRIRRTAPNGNMLRHLAITTPVTHPIQDELERGREIMRSPPLSPRNSPRPRPSSSRRRSPQHSPQRSPRPSSSAPH